MVESGIPQIAIEAFCPTSRPAFSMRAETRKPENAALLPPPWKLPDAIENETSIWRCVKVKALHSLLF
jgi:hypothetical protein